MRCFIAEVNDPFSCPNNSLSINSDGIAAQFTSIIVLADLLLFSWIHLATSSLPLPLGPVTNTRASVGATRSMVSLIFWIAGEWPRISLVFETFFFNTLVSVAKAPLSSAFRTVIKRRFRSGGFEMKSNAPFLLASTAVSTVPWPEIIINGRSGLVCCDRLNTSNPSILFILMSHSTRS
ncbi:hypothetical protein D3C80_904980 [compost metagenome]